MAGERARSTQELADFFKDGVRVAERSIEAEQFRGGTVFKEICDNLTVGKNCVEIPLQLCTFSVTQNLKKVFKKKGFSAFIRRYPDEGIFRVWKAPLRKRTKPASKDSITI
jgi:hypothetical protein